MYGTFKLLLKAKAANKLRGLQSEMPGSRQLTEIRQLEKHHGVRQDFLQEHFSYLEPDLYNPPWYFQQPQQTVKHFRMGTPAFT